MDTGFPPATDLIRHKGTCIRFITSYGAKHKEISDLELSSPVTLSAVEIYNCKTPTDVFCRHSIHMGLKSVNPGTYCCVVFVAKKHLQLFLPNQELNKLLFRKITKRST